MRICFSSSQMNAIGGFSARLNGFRRDHPSKMRRHQKQTNGLSGNSRTTDMKGAGLLPARSRRKRKPQPGGIPAGAFRGIGNLVLGAANTLKLQLAVLPVTSQFVVVSCCPRYPQGAPPYCHAKGKTPAKASEAAGALEVSAVW